MGYGRLNKNIADNKPVAKRLQAYLFYKKMGSFSLDKICISDLTLPCIIGINDVERVERQEVSIDIVLFADFKKACESDDIRDTVNYKSLKNNIREFVVASQFFLIEKLASEIVKRCFDLDKLIEEVWVTVQKPGALRYARTVSVEVRRKRSFYEG